MDVFNTYSHREINQKINKLHERALRVVYKNNNLTFEQLLYKDKSFTIHERNIQKLAVKMYKVKHNLCPKPIQESFTPTVRGNNEWVLPKVTTVNRGLETTRPYDMENSSNGNKKIPSRYPYLRQK